MSTKTTSKTIRLPESLCSQLTAQAEQSGKSFSAIVIDRLTQATPVVITEGTALVQLLFDLSSKLDSKGLAEDVATQVASILEQIVDLIYDIRQKYQVGGEAYGNFEGS